MINVPLPFSSELLPPAYIVNMEQRECLTYNNEGLAYLDQQGELDKECLPG
jgi:hypothetical protein